MSKTIRHPMKSDITTVEPRLFEVPGTAGILSNNR